MRKTCDNNAYIIVTRRKNIKEEFTPTLFPLPGTNNILFAYNTKIGQPNYVEPLESKNLDKVLDMGLSIVKSKGTEEEKTEGVIIVAEDKMVNVSLDSSRKQFRPINATVKKLSGTDKGFGKRV